MKLNNIRLHNFRNYTEKEFVCSENGAFILGPNGSGKTNLLEAIAYNSLGKSFRYHSDEKLLRHEQNEFSLKADFTVNQLSCSIKCEYYGGRKHITINRIPVRQMSSVYEYVKVIYCSPDDVYLVNGSPRKRRQYFDLAISQLNPSYIKLLRHYYHVVEQRNLLLKDINQKKQKKQWDEQFLQAALPVTGLRINYISRLNDKIKSLYSSILDEAKDLGIVYNPTINPLENPEKKDTYQSELRRIEVREWQYQRTLMGPHLDDYEFLLESMPVRDIGSQGQKRSITLLTKIAHLEMLREEIGEYPILLLDDIFAELDKQHTGSFMQILRNHEQVFVASPNAVNSDFWHNLPVIDLGMGD